MENVSTINDPKVLETLQQMKEEIEEGCKRFIFDTKSPISAKEYYEAWRDNVASLFSHVFKDVDSTINPKNKTGWTDQMLFHFFTCHGMDITSFDNIKEVRMDGGYDEKNKKLSMGPVIEWNNPAERIILEINIKDPLS